MSRVPGTSSHGYRRMTVLPRVSQGNCKAKFLSFPFRSDVLLSENKIGFVLFLRTKEPH